MQVLKDALRSVKAFGFAAATLLVVAAPAMASPFVLLQDPQPPVRVEITTPPTHTVWYADPLWLTIGGLVLLLVIVLAVMAGRRDSSTTTVIR